MVYPAAFTPTSPPNMMNAQNFQTAANPQIPSLHVLQRPREHFMTQISPGLYNQSLVDKELLLC